jgi:hypothetical protein
MLGIACPDGHYCDYPDDWCGGTDGSGVCRVAEVACPEFYQPTCGCDGEVYGSACAANAAGVDISACQGCSRAAGPSAASTSTAAS